MEEYQRIACMGLKGVISFKVFLNLPFIDMGLGKIILFLTVFLQNKKDMVSICRK